MATSNFLKGNSMFMLLFKSCTNIRTTLRTSHQCRHWSKNNLSFIEHFLDHARSEASAQHLLSAITMSATNKNQEKEENVPAESDDDFHYEEVSVEGNWSLTEREEDLEATVKAIQDQVETAAAPRPTTHTPETVVDFLRNFLVYLGMTETLDCFQTEWFEMVQKGLVDPDRVGVVPDVYTENQHLDSELRNAQLEAEEYRLGAAAGAETLARVQRDRDFHRLQHQRVVREKNRLIEEIKKLKVQCDNYEPAVKRMNEKYQAVLKQTMLVTQERDKALGEVKGQSAQLSTGEDGDKETKNPVIQPRPPANSPRSQTRVKSVKAKV